MFDRIASLPQYVRFEDDRLALMLCSLENTDAVLRAVLLDVALATWFKCGRQVVVSALWRPLSDKFAQSAHADRPGRVVDFFIRDMTQEHLDFLLWYHTSYHARTPGDILVVHGNTADLKGIRLHLQVPRNPAFNPLKWTKSDIIEELSKRT